MYHGGSYFTGIRGNNANEFDLNFLLKLPIIDDSSIQLNDDKCHPGYANWAIRGNVQDIIKPNSIHILPLWKRHILKPDVGQFEKESFAAKQASRSKLWMKVKVFS